MGPLSDLRPGSCESSSAAMNYLWDEQDIHKCSFSVLCTDMTKLSRYLDRITLWYIRMLDRRAHQSKEVIINPYGSFSSLS